MHLYIIRHADPDYVRNSLTPQGILEAKALASRLLTHGLDVIYTSDTIRSIETARCTGDAIDIPYQLLSWLREPDDLHIEQQGRTYKLWDTFGETVRADSCMPTQQDWYTRAPFDSPKVRLIWQAFREQCDSLLAQYGYLRDGGAVSDTTVKPKTPCIFLPQRNCPYFFWRICSNCRFH